MATEGKCVVAANHQGGTVQVVEAAAGQTAEGNLCSNRSVHTFHGSTLQDLPFNLYLVFF